MSRATITVHGSIYSPSESGIIYAQLLDEGGNPINDAAVFLTLFREDNTKYIDNQQMSYIPGSNGIYKYSFTAPPGPERMIAEVKCEDLAAHGTEDIYVPEWTDEIRQLEEGEKPIKKASFNL